MSEADKGLHDIMRNLNTRGKSDLTTKKAGKFWTAKDVIRCESYDDCSIVAENEATIAAQAKDIRKLKFRLMQKFVADPKFKSMSAELTKKDREIEWLKGKQGP